MDKPLNIEVVYALPERQYVLPMQVAPATTVLQAVLQSGIAGLTGIDVEHCALGIFSQRVLHPETQLVAEGDRIELYRPLQIDPKEARRLRAERTAKRVKFKG